MMTNTFVQNDKPRDEEAHRSFLATASFPKKLFDLVTTGDPNIIRWEENGRVFRIMDADRFAEFILPLYFRHSKLTSFQRQLNLYGFRRITKGEDQGAYFHPKFQRGKPDSVAEIRRLQGKAAPSHSGHANSGHHNISKKNVHFPTFSLAPHPAPTPVVTNESALSMLPAIDPVSLPPPLDTSVSLHSQLISGYGCVEDNSGFDRGVSDFCWNNKALDGTFDDFDINMLDALFDADPETLS